MDCQFSTTAPLHFHCSGDLHFDRGVLSILHSPKDIFPSINIPVISVIWTYTGMEPTDVSDHLTTPYERVLTTTVDNIEHIESESIYGMAVVKSFCSRTLVSREELRR